MNAVASGTGNAWNAQCHACEEVARNSAPPLETGRRADGEQRGFLKKRRAEGECGKYRKKGKGQTRIADPASLVRDAFISISFPPYK